MKKRLLVWFFISTKSANGYNRFKVNSVGKNHIIKKLNALFCREKTITTDRGFKTKKNAVCRIYKPLVFFHIYYWAIS
jgi:hypothetical protein